MAKKVIDKKKQEAELGARRAILEDLFYDFNSSKAEIFRMNFFRGIFLGFGTVLGGTLVVAILIGLLSLFASVPGGLGDFVRFIIDTVQPNN